MHIAAMAHSGYQPSDLHGVCFIPETARQTQYAMKPPGHLEERPAPRNPTKILLAPLKTSVPSPPCTLKALICKADSGLSVGDTVKRPLQTLCLKVKDF